MSDQGASAFQNVLNDLTKMWDMRRGGRKFPLHSQHVVEFTVWHAIYSFTIELGGI